MSAAIRNLFLSPGSAQKCIHECEENFWVQEVRKSAYLLP